MTVTDPLADAVAAIAGDQLGDAQRAVLVDRLDRAKYLHADGTVDLAALTVLVDDIIAVNGTPARTDHGRQAGLDEAKTRFGDGVDGTPAVASADGKSRGRAAGAAEAAKRFGGQ